MAAREIGQHLGVLGAGHERVEHRAPGLAHDVGATQPNLMPVSSIALCNRSVSRSGRAAFDEGAARHWLGLNAPGRDVSLRPSGAECAYCSPCLASRLRP